MQSVPKNVFNNWFLFDEENLLRLSAFAVELDPLTDVTLLDIDEVDALGF